MKKDASFAFSAKIFSEKRNKSLDIRKIILMFALP